MRHSGRRSALIAAVMVFVALVAVVYVGRKEAAAMGGNPAANPACSAAATSAQWACAPTASASPSNPSTLGSAPSGSSGSGPAAHASGHHPKKKKKGHHHPGGKHPKGHHHKRHPGKRHRHPGQPLHGAAAAQVLTLINNARAQAGLPALAALAGLKKSAKLHNKKMAGKCGLSHQCPKEKSLLARIAAAGVHASSVGENIGDGGPVAKSKAAITQMAVSLAQSMLNEKPPNDGHRQNMLSHVFTHIGIAVHRSKKTGTVWMTMDFAN